MVGSVGYGVSPGRGLGDKVPGPEADQNLFAEQMLNARSSCTYTPSNALSKCIVTRSPYEAHWICTQPTGAVRMVRGWVSDTATGFIFHTGIWWTLYCLGPSNTLRSPGA